MKIVKAILELQQEQARRRLTAGAGVRLQETATGTVLSVKDEAGGTGGVAAAAAGGFFTIDTREITMQGEMIYIYDATGLLSEGASQYCGVFVSGTDQMLVPVELIEPTQSGFVIMVAKYHHAAPGVNAQWEIDFNIVRELPPMIDDQLDIILGYVEVSDGRVEKITQLWHGGIVYNGRYS